MATKIAIWTARDDDHVQMYIEFLVVAMVG